MIHDEFNASNHFLDFQLEARATYDMHKGNADLIKLMSTHVEN